MINVTVRRAFNRQRIPALSNFWRGVLGGLGIEAILVLAWLVR